MFLYYLIFNRTIGTTDNLQHIRFLKFTGWLSLSLQGAFAVFVTIKGRNVFDGYNYYSPAVVLGVIIAAAAFVTSSLTFTQRFIGVLACLVLAMTTGHASAFLGVIMVLLTYLFLLTNNKSRLIIAGAGLLLLISFYLVLPQFSDANAGWRLLTWNHFLYKSIIDNYALIGNGFGVPYFDNEIVSKLFKDLGAVGFFSLETPMERWLSTAHNSFITIFFAIGFIPGLLIFYPLVGAVRYALNRKNVKNPDTDFLLISFIGTSVWCAMNVVLELPHSAGYYWLIYFTFCNQIGRGFDRRAESMNVS